MYLLSAKHGQYITILTDSPGLATLGRSLAWLCMSQLPFGSKPPTQINKECVAGVALPRHTGNTLFTLFWGRGGEEEKDV